MIRRLADKCMEFLAKRTELDASKLDAYVYGLEIFLHTLLSTLGLLVISAFFHRLAEGSVIIMLYYINQTCGGGFHASTHTRCFLTMSVGLMIALTLLNYRPPYIGIWVITVLAGGLLLCFPLKLHRNKAYLASKSSEFKRRSRIAVCIELVVFIAWGCLGTANVLYAYSLGMAVSAVSRLTAILIREKETE